MYISIIDAARDYNRVVAARLICVRHRNLYLGDKGERLDHVAPHLFACDPQGQVDHLTLSGIAPDEIGIAISSDARFDDLFKHFRRFLVVRRQRDRRQVLFRYYDPRVLRAFLPVCTADELERFFGPVERFVCQGDVPGEVVSFSRDGARRLRVERESFDDFFLGRHGVRPSSIAPIPDPTPTPRAPDPARRLRTLVMRRFGMPPGG